jgi:hypothetical protein
MPARGGPTAPYQHVSSDGAAGLEGKKRPYYATTDSYVLPERICAEAAVWRVTAASSATTHPGSHPVCRRPTHRGAGVVQGVKVERPAGRTTLTPWAATARLCLGRRRTGWEHPAHATLGRHSRTAPPPSRSLSAPAGGCSDRGRFSTVIDSCPGSGHVGARRRSAGGAGRRQERRPRRSREARPAERSAAALNQ